MVAVILTKGGILTTLSLEKSKTVTAKWDIETSLPQLLGNLVSCAPLNSWFLQDYNVPAHRVLAMQEFLEGMEVQLLERPAYSPDLAPCEFGLFPYVKLRTKARRFSSDEELSLSGRMWFDIETNVGGMVWWLVSSYEKVY